MASMLSVLCPQQTVVLTSPLKNSQDPRVPPFNCLDSLFFKFPETFSFLVTTFLSQPVPGSPSDLGKGRLVHVILQENQ